MQAFISQPFDLPVQFRAGYVWNALLNILSSSELTKFTLRIICGRRLSLLLLCNKIESPLTKSEKSVLLSVPLSSLLLKPDHLKLRERLVNQSPCHGFALIATNSEQIVSCALL